MDEQCLNSVCLETEKVKEQLTHLGFRCIFIVLEILHVFDMLSQW